MATLHERLAGRIESWRTAAYPADECPAIGEILDWARDPESGQLRYLRSAQFRALETYWYLRLIENTPHILDLYRSLFPKQSELLDALGVGNERITRLVPASRSARRTTWWARLVRLAEQKGTSVDRVDASASKAIHPALPGLIASPGSWEDSVERRATAGGSSRKSVLGQLKALEKEFGGA